MYPHFKRLGYFAEVLHIYVRRNHFKESQTFRFDHTTTFGPTGFSGSQLTFSTKPRPTRPSKRKVFVLTSSLETQDQLFDPTGFFGAQLTFFDQTSTNSTFNKKVFVLTSSLETLVQLSTQPAFGLWSPHTSLDTCMLSGEIKPPCLSPILNTNRKSTPNSLII